MEPDRTGITSFLSSALRDLPFALKPPTFFGTVFVFWGLATGRMGLLLFGVALLLLSFGGYFWWNRHIGFVSGEEQHWYQYIVWRNVVLAFLFFAGSGFVFFRWARLPEVVAALKSTGIWP